MYTGLGYSRQWHKNGGQMPQLDKSNWQQGLVVSSVFLRIKLEIGQPQWATQEVQPPLPGQEEVLHALENLIKDL